MVINVVVSEQFKKMVAEDAHRHFMNTSEYLRMLAEKEHEKINSGK